MAFDVGSIVAYLELKKNRWDASIRAVQKDQKSLQGMIIRNSQSIQRMGRNMTIAGALITGAVGFMLKKTSDYEETTAKFGTVFQNVYKKANEVIKDLTTNYGLSSLAAKEMVGDTGDILTGFGFTSEAAIKLSERVSKLGVDLASFTNIEGGAERAVMALTSAMVGETERAKMLGIVIRQDSKEFIGLVEQYQKTENMSLLQAKAMAALTIASKQSKNAMGDFARTQGSLANQGRIATATLEDLTIQLGQALIPVVTEMLGQTTKILKGITEWIRENPKLAATLVKLIAGFGLFNLTVGPILRFLPSMVRGFQGVRTVIASLPKPIGKVAGLLGKAGIWGGIAIAAAKGVQTAFDLIFDSIDKGIGKLYAAAKSTAVLKAEIKAFRDSNAEAAEIVKTVTDRLRKFGYEGDELFKKVHLHLTRKDAWEAWRAQVEKTKKSTTELTDEQKENAKKMVEIVSDMKDQIAKLTLDDFRYRRQKAQEEYQERIDILKQLGASEKEYAVARRLRDAELAQITKDQTEKEKEAIEQQKEFWQGYVDQRIEGMQYVHDLAEELKDVEMESELQGQELKFAQLDAWAEKQRATLNSMHLDMMSYFAAVGLLNRIYYTKKNQIEQDNKKKYGEMLIENLKKTQEFVGRLTNVWSLYYQFQQGRLDKWYRNQKEYIEKNITDEEARETALSELDKEYDEKRRSIQRKAAIADKASAMMAAIVNTAQAVTKALAQGGFFGGPIFAAIVGALGAAQIALIAAQPIPALQEGGIAMGETPAIVGEGGEPELIAPLSRLPELMRGMRAETPEGRPITIINNVSALDATGVEKVLHEKLIPGIQEALKDEVLLIHPKAVRAY